MRGEVGGELKLRTEDKGLGLTTGRVFFASPSLDQFDWTLFPSVLCLLLDVPPPRPLSASTCSRTLGPRLPRRHYAINNCAGNKNNEKKRKKTGGREKA